MGHWPLKRDLTKWRWSFRGTSQKGSRRIEWTTEPEKGWSFEAPGFNPAMMRKGSNFVMPLARSSSYPMIGAVALHWGDFEIKMDSLLAAFVAADADPNDQEWQRLPFKKRKGLLQRKAKKRFPGRISDEITRILRLAATYHWQRNLVIHGHFKLEVKNAVVTTYAEGMVRRRLVRLPVTDEHLERMYHEISFLAGRLIDLSAKRGGGLCWLSLRDRSKIRAFLAKHRPNPATPKKIPPQHPPLRELSVLHRKPPGRGRKRPPVDAKVEKLIVEFDP